MQSIGISRRLILVFLIALALSIVLVAVTLADLTNHLKHDPLVAPKALSGQSQQGSWQSYLFVPESEFSGWAGTSFPEGIEALGKPHEGWLSTQLATTEAELFAISGYQHAEIGVFELVGDEFIPTPNMEPDNFKGFHAYGYSFAFEQGSLLSATDDSGSKKSIKVKEGSYSWAFGASSGSVFVGTSRGEALRFDANGWCRLTQVSETRYECRSQQLKAEDVPEGRQFYGTVNFQDELLVGDYPNGWTWRFDGVRLVRDDVLTYPKIRDGQLNRPLELQTMAFYCGALYQGIWPHGQLYRYNGQSWDEPLRLFSDNLNPSQYHFPFEQEAMEAGEASNYWSQRILSLVPFNGSLYVSTSNKWIAETRSPSGIPESALLEYGTVYKITDPNCAKN